MTATTFRVPVCFTMGLFLSCWISLIYPIHAAPYLASSRSSRQLKTSPSVSNELQADAAPTTKTVEEIEIVSKLNDSTPPAPKKAEHTIFRSKLLRLKNLVSPNTVLSLFGFGADTAIRLMTGVENFINGRSNIEEVDAVMSMFTQLFASKGATAVLTYYTLFGNFWVNVDAFSHYVRGMENRIVVSRTEIQAAITEKEASEIVEKKMLSLAAVNAQIEELKNNLVNLIRRQEIARIGAVTRNEDAVEPQSELSVHEVDDDSDAEHDEDEDELTRKANNLADQIIPAVGQTVLDGTLDKEYFEEETSDIEQLTDEEEAT